MNLLIALLALTHPSHAAAPSEGLFVSPTDSFYLTNDRAECERNGGRYEGDEEFGDCFVTVDDSVQITRAAEEFSIKVVTFGSNMHSCGFDGVAKVVGETLVSTGEGEEPGQTCEVTVSFPQPDIASVSTNGNCRAYCGARAFGLGIESARRK